MLQAADQTDKGKGAKRDDGVAQNAAYRAIAQGFGHQRHQQKYEIQKALQAAARGADEIRGVSLSVLRITGVVAVHMRSPFGNGADLIAALLPILKIAVIYSVQAVIP